MLSQAAMKTAPVIRRVRAYFAPVDRASKQPSVFDAAQAGRFALHAPPPPWTDLGWCVGFQRRSETVVEPLKTGSPAMAQGQVRTQVEARVGLEFESWGKLQMALASGSQQMNLLVTQQGAAPNGSGGGAADAVALAAGSTASSLTVGAAAAALFSVGDLLAVDRDYAGETGYVGSGVSSGYVRQATDVAGDPHYLRRVTLNVGQVEAIADGVLQLAAPLLAGVPADGMKVCRTVGFVDREGGSFFQEWTGLFCAEGEQGDRILYYYPRLQAMLGSAEAAESLAGAMERVRLKGEFRALPVADANDGEAVLCFRSYLPATVRAT